jgi:hypothetical protein
MPDTPNPRHEPDLERFCGVASRRGRLISLPRVGRLRNILSRLRARAERSSELAHWPAAVVPGQRRVLIHAGLHKTGTTALQRFLATAAEELRGQGVLYPNSGRPLDLPDAHYNIAWQMGGDRRFRSSAGTLDDVAFEISSFPGDAILSSEDFESILGTPLAFVPLLKHPLLKEHSFTIVFWVRDQASYLESLFFEMLKHRMAEEASRFCESALACGQVRHEDWAFHFDYESIRTGLLELPVKVAVRPYDLNSGGSTVFDFLTFTGLVGNSYVVGSEGRINSRISLAQALSLFCQHRLGKELADRILQCDCIVRLFEGRTAHLSSSIRAALIARFAAGNDRLARASGFPPETLAISPLAPVNSFPLEAIFSLRTQSVLADSAGDRANPTHFTSSAVDYLLRNVWLPAITDPSG